APRRPDAHTLSLHDALPIFQRRHPRAVGVGIGDERAGVEPPELDLPPEAVDDLPARDPKTVRTAANPGNPASPRRPRRRRPGRGDRKSTRLNSSHRTSSYAV